MKQPVTIPKSSITVVDRPDLFEPWGAKIARLALATRGTTRVVRVPMSGYRSNQLSPQVAYWFKKAKARMHQHEDGQALYIWAEDDPR